MRLDNSPRQDQGAIENFLCRTAKRVKRLAPCACSAGIEAVIRIGRAGWERLLRGGANGVGEQLTARIRIVFTACWSTSVKPMMAVCFANCQLGFRSLRCGLEMGWGEGKGEKKKRKRGER